MQKLIIIIIIPFMFGCGAKWSKSTKGLACAYGVLHVVDYFQTIEIADNDNWYEINGLIGKHPSKERVTYYFLCSGAATWLFIDVMPPEYRNYFLDFGICFKGGLVYHNYSIGIRF